MSLEPLHWFPKPFAPGDIDGEGARKLLGRPSLHPLVTLVRETAQNSWDATRPGQQLQYELGLRTLTGEELRILGEFVFANPGRGTSLAGALKQKDLVILEIHDRGTSGLGGPMRNDMPIDPGETTDYVDFVLNVGAPRDTTLGGGTYGFGKTITYLASDVDTMLIWSQPEDELAQGTRFVASAMGDAFEMADRRFTGRQWWGAQPEEGSGIRPVCGANADTLGNSLFSRGFGPKETGTSLMVLGVCRPDEMEMVSEILAEAVTWNIWPKLLPHDGVQAMTARVLLNGQPVRSLDPQLDRRLSPFMTSLGVVRDLQAGREPTVPGLTNWRAVDVRRPSAELGHVALTWHPRLEAEKSDPLLGLEDLSGIRPFEGPARHVALMRQAELVVTYLEGPPPQVDRVEYGGVFRCLAEVDDAFAAAEPPAHDEWQPAGVPNRTYKTYVNVGLRRIKEAIGEFARGTKLRRSATGVAPSQGVASIVSAELADLVDHQLEAPACDRPSVRRVKEPSGPSLTVGEAVFREHEGRTYALVPVEVVFEVAARVVCQTGIGYEGGSEKDSDGPVCHGYAVRVSDANESKPPRWEAGEAMELHPGDPTSWTAYVEVPASLTAEIDIQVAAIPGTS